MVRRRDLRPTDYLWRVVMKITGTEAIGGEIFIPPLPSSRRRVEGARVVNRSPYRRQNGTRVRARSSEFTAGLFPSRGFSTGFPRARRHLFRKRAP